ncbi:MAG: queuosine salvage family protein [bacterium]
MIDLNEQKIDEIKSLFQERIARQTDRSLAPWQQKQTVAGVSLFPAQNNEQAIDFIFLLGALNFSYWQKNEGKIYTWGVTAPGGEEVIDVFALAYCLADADAQGWLDYDADFYQDITEDQLEKIFSDRINKSCEIPMFHHRILKIRELGRGLKKFARAEGKQPAAGSFLEHYNSIPGVMAGLEEYFPYSYGDPFRKLPQLMVKMLIDRRQENMPTDKRFETDDFYRRATLFSGIDELKAQPDYMLPLFCLRMGLWEVEDALGRLIAGKKEIPMDHPYEQEIRRKTVRTVEMIAEALEGNPGLNNCRVDSIIWQTAVEGCFAGECEDCFFNQNCDAYQGRNNRLSWPHHLTRTPNY